MSRKLLANAFCTMLPDDPSVVAILLITTPPSSKTKISGGGVYLDGATVAATTVTSGTYAGTGPFTADFVTTANKVNDNGEYVLRLGDTSEDITASLTNTVSPFDPKDFVFKAEITNAGQTKVLGE